MHAYISHGGVFECFFLILLHDNRGDWLLQFVYRTASMQVSDIAGLEPIRWKDRRMVNVDLTDIVSTVYSGMWEFRF